ncbi:MAG: extracellular solute-binding protein [Alphaproteobacteria bacterium]|nr:extracellular solute-binding protein [Alphaproteobacteria bacterium]
MTDATNKFTMGRRDLAKLAAGAATLSLLPGAAQAQANYDAAKREGKLTLYTDLPGETAEKVTTLFKNKYAGIAVEFFRGDTTQVFQRFQTETGAGRHTVDVLTSTVRRTRHMIARNMVAPYKSATLANYPADIIPSHNLWSVYAITLTGFAWNTRQVAQGQEPKSWDDLLDPKWRGKIGMQDPIQGGGVASWVATMYAGWGEAKWTNYMTKLAAQEPRYGRYLQIQDLLGGGEIAVHCAAYPDYIQSTLKAKGAPVEWGVPDPTVRTALSTSVSANAPNPNAAKLFVDHMLSTDVQKLLGDVGSLPALAAQRPAHFARLANAKFIDSADEVEEQKQEFFQAKIREFFGRR